MAIDLSKFIIRFIEEARDHLQLIQTGLAQLDTQTATTDTIHALFRSAHTIKGSSRMLKLLPITELAHQMEEVLSALRDHKHADTTTLSQPLYQALDTLAAQLDQLEQHLNPADITPAQPSLLAQLQQLATGDSAQTPTTDTPPIAEALPTTSTDEPPTAEAKLKINDTVRIRLNKLDELLSLMSEMVASHVTMRQHLTDLQQITQLNHEQTPFERIRQLTQQYKTHLQQQEMHMHELLDKALLMRMLPLAVVFDPVTRVVRELAQSIGKQVQCTVTGSDIELDRQLIDKLSDPLVHLIRNAIDHGIEPPDIRITKGKAAQGKLQLSAQQSAAWVIIELSDDGGGVSLDAIKDKAQRKQLASAEQLNQLSESELIDFIFLPGFSTSNMITDLSGRGVGMDVVKKTIVDDLQGDIRVHSSPQGTTFTLRLPLSLAMMRMIIISTQQQHYAFTAQYVSELIRLDTHHIRTVAERQTFILRNEFIPILPLSQFLGLTTPPITDGNLLLLIIQLRHEKLALIIDQIIDEQEMVLKPLPKHLQHFSLYGGAVIDGHNHIIPILQPAELFRLARQAKQSQQANSATQHQTTIEAHHYHILVVDDSLNTREIEKDVLEAHGYQVSLAEDGLDGLRKAKATHFDAILTDVEMPHMDGFTLTSHLRQEADYQHTPIIIITSREKEEDKRRGIQVGADAYIVKGDFDQNNLVETLNALLS